MLPFVRGCRNLDCECHSLAHTTEKMIPDPSFRNLVGESQGDWKKEFEQRYLRDGSWILDGKNGAEIISFIRQLLSKREEEVRKSVRSMIPDEVIVDFLSAEDLPFSVREFWDIALLTPQSKGGIE